MKGFKSKKGISLIVLIITIIVMIILAAAIILSISNSGIMDKANKAKEDSDTANLKEYVNVLEAEWELMTPEERNGKTSVEYVNEELSEKYPNKTYSVDGEIYTDLPTAVKEVIAKGLKIGDKVTGYELDTSKSSTGTTGEENTYGEYNCELNEEDYVGQTVFQTAFTSWKYIGIGKNGEILITPDMPESVKDNQKITLSGKGAFLKGPDVLDTVCDALYTTSKGFARSMDIDDVFNILDYDGYKVAYRCDKSDTLRFSKEPLTLEEISNLLGEEFEFDSSYTTFLPYGSDIYKYIINDIRCPT